MQDVGIELFANQLRAMANDLDEWNKRTNEPTRSPQEPVVQSACNQTTLPEQPALVVQDGKEPSDHKALPVQSAADRLDELDCEFAKAIKEHVENYHMTKNTAAKEWYRGVVAGLKDGLILARVFIQKKSQVEQEAKRDAAD